MPVRASDPTTEITPSNALDTVSTRVPADEVAERISDLLAEDLVTPRRSFVTQLVAVSEAESITGDKTQAAGTQGSGRLAGHLEEADLKHEVREEIGRGGMGRILRVRDNDLNREVAMKVLLDEEEGGRPNFRRFIEEAQITSQLEHPNVLPVHEFGVNGEGGLYFTMKFIREHDTLADVIERLAIGDEATHAEYSFERRVQVVQQVCNALHYAHRRGVIHRDIKPENVVLGDCGEVYLVDWGVAKVLSEGAPPGDESGPVELVETLSSLDEARHTQRGSLVGTPYYMSPEQVMRHDEEVGPPSDLYSLSALLFELLCTRHYLDDANTRTVGALAAAILARKAPKAESYLHPVNGRVPRHLSRIVAKGLAKKIPQRYATAMELHADLQAWLEGRGPIICPGTALQRVLSGWSAWIDRHPVGAPAISIALIVIVLGAALTSFGLLIHAIATT